MNLKRNTIPPINMSEIHHLNGSCHCKNIQYIFKTTTSPADYSVRKCLCSYCQKKGNRYISDPKGELEIMIKQDESVQRYQFGTRTADFLICKNCGVIPVVTCEIDNQIYAVININSLEKVGDFNRHSQEADFDRESTQNRLQRRKKNWIGKVTIAKDQN